MTGENGKNPPKLSEIHCFWLLFNLLRNHNIWWPMEILYQNMVYFALQRVFIRLRSPYRAWQGFTPKNHKIRAYDTKKLGVSRI